MGRYVKNSRIKHAGQHAIHLPSAPTVLRPYDAVDGQIRFNTTTNETEIFYTNQWHTFTMAGNVTVVKDEFAGDGSTTAFGPMTYSYAASEEGLTVVFVDNVHQNPGVSYSFSGSKYLTFTSAPPNGATILVLHRYASTDYTSNPYVPPPFSPSDLANLVAWYQFNTGITEETGVSVWADQSGNDFHLVQADTSKQPAVSSGVITFDGTDDFLRSPLDNTAFPSVNTVYILARQDVWTADDRLLDGYYVNRGGFYQVGTSPSVVMYRGSGGPSTTTNWGINSFAALALVFNGASSLVQVGSGGTPATGNPGAQIPGGITLGGIGEFGGTNNGQVSFKEVLFYSAAHDDATRALVLEYLESL